METHAKAKGNVSAAKILNAGKASADKYSRSMKTAAYTMVNKATTEKYKKEFSEVRMSGVSMTRAATKIIEISGTCTDLKIKPLIIGDGLSAMREISRLMSGSQPNVPNWIKSWGNVMAKIKLAFSDVEKVRADTIKSAIDETRPEPTLIAVLISASQRDAVHVPN